MNADLSLRVVQVKTHDPAGLRVRVLACDDNGHSVEFVAPASTRPFVGQRLAVSIALEVAS